MLKLLFHLLFFAFSSSLLAQKIEFSGGVNHNMFTNGLTYTDDIYTNSSYSSGNGFGVYVALDSLRYEFMVYRFTLGFEQYRGGFDVSTGTKAGSTHHVGDVVKSKIMLGVYPGNFRFNNWDLNLGVEFGFLVDERVTGTSTTWSYTLPEEQVSELGNEGNLSSNFSLDLKMRLAYDFYFGHDLAVSPILSINYGFNEFNDLLQEQSLRLFFGVGVEKTLLKK
jgi:hypothetical protein